jgi:Fe-S oxidoreductase
VLGDEEQCHCEWARRGGNEFLYQESVVPIIETLNGYEFTTIITHCPHCFNTMANEFPDFGGHYQVVHHSQYIAKLINEGKIKPTYSNSEAEEMAEAVRQITYHDSCYLGRYNDEYDSPRQMLKALPGVELIEMARSRERGLCCGGGGAQVFMETHQTEPVNMVRLTEAVDALNGKVPMEHTEAPRKLHDAPLTMQKAGTVATACPFCTIMLDSAQQSMQVENLQIRDVAEIIADTL